MTRCLLLAAALAAITGCSPDLSPTSVVYGPVNRDLDDTVAEAHSIDLAGDATYLVMLDQLEGDLLLEARAPDGRRITTVDNPLGRGELETMLIETTDGGEYAIAVRSTDCPTRRGRYRLTVEELQTSTRDDQRRAAAEASMTAGGELNYRAETSGDAEEVEALRRKSVEQYQIAHSLWKDLRQTPQQAKALHAAAALYYQLFEWKRAADLADTAARLYEKADDEPAIAKALQLRGEALLETQEKEDFERALFVLDDVLSRQRSLGNPLGEALTTNTLGMAHFQQDQLGVARKYFVTAGGMFGELGERQQGIWALNNVAVLDQMSGNLPSAIARYEEALALAESTCPKERAHVFHELALAHSILGNLQEALIRYEQAEEIFEGLGDRLGKARALRGRGMTYGRLGDWEAALGFLRQAQELQEGPAEARIVVKTHLNIGMAQRRLGEFTEALDTHRKALALAKTPAQQAEAHLELGRDYGAAGEIEKSAEHLDLAMGMATTDAAERTRALALHERGKLKLANDIDPEAGLEDLEQALESHRTSRSEVGEAQTLHDIARAKHKLGRVDEANEHISRALEIIEKLRVRIGSPLLRLSFTGLQLPTYEMHIGLLMELDARRDDNADGVDYMARALEVSERARARSLIELLHESRTAESQGIDPELLSERERKRNELIALAHRNEVSTDAERIAKNQRRIQTVRADLDVIEEQIRQQNKPYAELTQPSGLSAPDIQRLLAANDGPGTVLLEYSLGEERSFLWRVTADSLKSWTLPGRAEIELAARELYGHFSTAAGDRAAAREAARSAARLSELVLRPALDDLDGRRVVVVPDGALQYVPFGALPVDDSSTPLLDRHEVVTLPSASTLSVLRETRGQRVQPSKTIAIFADPVFDEHDARLTAVANPRSALARSPASQGPLLQRLPGTGKEADAISRLAPMDQLLKATGFEANRDAVLKTPLSDYRLLHFATHGLIDTNNPERSGLGLSALDRSGNPQPGFLWLHDIYGLELNADLVVLSACQAHLGKDIRGEGLIGLTRGFMYAGAPRVIASLWLASDRATAALMGEFYRLLLQENASPAHALRRAQLWTAKQREWRHPYYWAGFTLQGDWR